MLQRKETCGGSARDVRVAQLVTDTRDDRGVKCVCPIAARQAPQRWRWPQLLARSQQLAPIVPAMRHPHLARCAPAVALQRADPRQGPARRSGKLERCAVKNCRRSMYCAASVAQAIMDYRATQQCHSGGCLFMTAVVQGDHANGSCTARSFAAYRQQGGHPLRPSCRPARRLPAAWQEWELAPSS
jgi:hypothetical protein